MSERYLSKSRFKLALECVTKLYYTGKKNEYADCNLDDPFLQALANGVFQVGELAKFMFCDDPIAEGITVDTLDYIQALAQTAEMLNRPSKVVIAEGAFKFNNLFMRADIVVKEGTRIDLYEVKAKSFDGDEVTDSSSFITSLGKPHEKVKSMWQPYIYDLAFQKHVMVNALPGYEIHAHLLMVDKSATATIDGLNQKFGIVKNNGHSHAEPKQGLKASMLGKPILKSVELDDLIDKIWKQYTVPSPMQKEMGFYDFVKWASEIYKNDRREFMPVSKECKKCQFYSVDKSFKNGIWECWKNHTNYSDDLLSKPWVLEIWGWGVGGRSLIQELIDQKIYLLENIEENNLFGKNGEPPVNNDIEGMTPHERRLLQIKKVKQQSKESFFNKAQFEKEMKSWTWPLNMIDFETSTVALPFHKNTKPYQGIAFQYSHHTIHADGSVRHESEFIHFEKGVFPNIEFIRALKKSLSVNEGTVFRYHNHENTYLRYIHRQLTAGWGDVNETERKELMTFIDSITQDKKNDYNGGPRNMVDLYNITQRLYYSPQAKGSISLKQILPAIISDSNYLKEKYSKNGVYGKALPIRSLNFDDQVWIDAAKGMDPYKMLDPVFKDYDKATLDNLVKDMEGLADGGAALTAYGYLQYTDLAEDQRVHIKNALLRYCELDTLAMVMIVEGWREWE